MLLIFTVFTACTQNMNFSILYEGDVHQTEIQDPDRYDQPLVVDWETIEDTWLGVGDELPSREENTQAYDILFVVYTEEFRPRIDQYREKNQMLTLEVEYLFGVVLRSMHNKHRLSRKSRKKQIEQLRINLEKLLENS